jgi:hypothetical protein
MVGVTIAIALLGHRTVGDIPLRIDHISFH